MQRLVQGAMITPSPASRKKRKTQLSRDTHHNIAIELLDCAPPAKKSRCCLHELIVLLSMDEKSPVFGHSVAALHRALEENDLAIVKLKTLQKWSWKFSTKGELPRPGDDGTRKGRPCMVPEDQLEKLNEVVFDNVGMVVGTQRLKEDVRAVVLENREAQGHVCHGEIKEPIVKLPNALHVPCLDCNLLSITRHGLQGAGCTFPAENGTLHLTHPGFSLSLPIPADGDPQFEPEPSNDNNAGFHNFSGGVSFDQLGDVDCRIRFV